MAINVKMGVSGVNEIKKAMSETQSAAKTLGAQMKLNETQFKQTGDAEAYLTQKEKLLQQSIEKQQQIANQAAQALQVMRNKGIEPTSKAYQEMQRKMVEAQTAMTGMQTDLDNLGKSSETAAEKTEALATGLGDISKKMSLDQVIEGLTSITSGLETAVKKSVELGETIWDAMVDSAAYADDISTLADKLKLTTTEVQQMQYVAGEFEASAEDIGKAWQRVKRSMGSDGQDVADMFESLGVAVRDGDGGLRDYKDVFWEIGEALMKMPDEVKQEEFATKLLGKSWTDLIPLFTAGREAYEAAMEAAPAASEEAVKASEQLNTRLEQLEGSWKALELELTGAIAPALEQAATALDGVIKTVTEYLKSDAGQEQLQKMSEALSNIIGDIANFDPQGVIDTVSVALGGIKDALEWVSKNWDTVKTGIEAIAGAWLATNAVIAGLKIWKLIQGIQGIGMGSVGTAGAVTGAAWGKAFGAAVMKAAPVLAGLYVALNPGNTAGDAEDDNKARNIRNYLEALEHFDSKKIDDLMEYDQSFQALLQQDYKTPEHLLRAIENMYGLERVQGGNGFFNLLRDENGNLPYFTDTAQVLEALDFARQEEAAEKLEEAAEELKDYAEKSARQAEEGKKFSMRLGNRQQLTYEQGEELRTMGLSVSKVKKGKTNYTNRPNGYAESYWEITSQDGRYGTVSDVTAAEVMKKLKEWGLEPSVVEIPQVELEDGWDKKLQEEINKKPLIATLNVQLRRGIGETLMPYANGLPYVPYDGMPAILHKGERVLTARENAANGRTYSSNLYVESMIMNNGMDARGLAEAMAAAQRRTANGYGS